MTSDEPLRTRKTLGLDSRYVTVIVFVLVIGLLLVLRMNHIWDSRKLTESAVPEEEQLDPSLSDDERKLYLLTEFSGKRAPEAIDEIVRTKDRRFIPPLIDVFRLTESGALTLAGGADYKHALEELGGVKLHKSTEPNALVSTQWIQWLGEREEIVPPDGYAQWKGHLFGLLDPKFEELFYDKVKSTIRVEEILFGGASFDAIRSVDQPQMIPAAEATNLDLEEPVFGIEINGDVRSYPQRYLDWHEMANDTIGGVPVSLAYCTLCGAGIAYDGRASNGKTYTFSSSGLLYRSNKLMFDRETRMLWNHLTGRPVVGELAGSDLKLKQLPVVTSSWGDWQKSHPDTKVLVLNSSKRFSYELGEPYGVYFDSSDTMFPVWQQSDRLPLKSRVFCLSLEESHKAYPLDLLTQERVINDDFASKPLVLIADRGSVAVETRVHDPRRHRYHDVKYNAGGEVSVYERGEHTFQPGSEPQTVLDEENGVWQVTEEALIGPQQQKLPRIAGHLAYWLGWYATHPDTEVYSR